MLLSISTGPMDKSLSYKEAIRLISEAGFDAFDFSLTLLNTDPNHIFNTDKYLEEAKKLREYADSI